MGAPNEAPRFCPDCLNNPVAFVTVWVRDNNGRTDIPLVTDPTCAGHRDIYEKLWPYGAEFQVTNQNDPFT
jgi:hypothetical protein